MKLTKRFWEKCRRSPNQNCQSWWKIFGYGIIWSVPDIPAQFISAIGLGSVSKVTRICSLLPMEKYWIINREVYTEVLRVNPLVNSDALKKAEEDKFPKGSQCWPQKVPELSMSDFSVHRIIGRGGFGEVFGCRKVDTGKMYAMKCLGMIHTYDPF